MKRKNGNPKPDKGIAGSGESESSNPRGKGGRVPDHVVEQRLRAVYSMMTQGHRTSAIYRIVAKAALKERKKRAEAKKTAKDIDDYPALVWGETVPSTRTIDDYIARARAIFEQEGRELTKAGATSYGQANAMIGDVYTRALAGARYAVCERLIRLFCELNGIMGVIKWTPDAGVQTPGEVPEVEQTEEQADAEMRELLATALKRSNVDPTSVKWLAGGKNGRN